MEIWRNEHERQIVLDLEAMTKTDEFWGRALASAVLRIWRELSVERQEMQRLLEGLLEIDRCATAIIGSHDTADYAIAVEQAERIGMIVTQMEAEGFPSLLRQAVRADARDATPEQLKRGADLYASLREGQQKSPENFNTKTRKRDPFYEDGGSGHDLAI